MTTAPARRGATLIALHLLLGVYALSDVASKYAAGTTFPSVLFFVCYGAMLVLLGIYALGWQQIIKRMPLSSAFANRAITIVWGIFWGAVLFNEAITPGKVIGAALIIAGIVVFARADNPPVTPSNAPGQQHGTHEPATSSSHATAAGERQ